MLKQSYIRDKCDGSMCNRNTFGIKRISHKITVEAKVEAVMDSSVSAV